MRGKRDSNTITSSSTSGFEELLGAEYEVFLSFRGPDTRLNFTDCLYHSLNGIGIRVFKDDEEIRKGEKIGEEILCAVNKSKIHMPIFSRDYASSVWCLRELAYMVEFSRRLTDKVILPIFFDVDPQDVKLRTGLYVEALRRHEKRFGYDEVQPWKEALTEVASMHGWDCKARGQGELIKLITDEVSMRLARRIRIVPDHLVGIDHHLQSVLQLLDKDCHDVRFVIIHGLGGVGKTALAKVVFNKIASQFDGCSFLSNIRELSQQGKIVKLQKRLLSDIFKSKSMKVDDTDCGSNMISWRCSHKKILIVLDNLDERDQLVMLAEKSNWFGSGSRIIITTRDVGIFKTYKKDASMHLNMYHFHEMEEMDEHYAIQLFRRHAFQTDALPVKYNRITREIVKITGRLPLALVVIGSSLCWESEEVWDDVLAKLKEIPCKEVKEVLRVSYDILDYEQKEIFLDIACHMAGERRDNAIIMWNACKYYPHEAISVLINKSLIKIKNDRILMHEQLRNLGRELVREESIKHPGKQSRIWCTSLAKEVIRAKEGTQKVAALTLGGKSQVCNITREDISRLVKLRFLELVGGKFVGDFQDLLLELRWFSWQNCPSEFQATNFSPSNLVVLKISESDITNDWDGWSQIMGNCRLKVLHLVSCRRLIKTPDFSTCVTLERLVVKDCDRLVEIDPSITMLQHLKQFVIKRCNCLRVLRGAPTTLNLGMVHGQSLSGSLGNFQCLLSTLKMEDVGLLELPDSIGEIIGLKVLSLCGSNIERLPDSIGKLESLVELDISFTSIIELPDSIRGFTRLEALQMERCKLRKLPKAIGMLEKLEHLDASFCTFLKGEIPMEIGNISSLKDLWLGGTRISEVPPSISGLSQLTSLSLGFCGELQQLPELPPSLEYLDIFCSALKRIPDLSNLTNLSTLCFSGQPKACQAQDLQWIRRLTGLSRLALEHSDVTALPLDFTNTLTELRRLSLSGSTIQSLEWIPTNIEKLRVYDLETTDVWSNLHTFKYLWSLKICRSCLTELRLDVLGKLPNLRSLEVDYCQVLESLSHLPSLKKLRVLIVHECPQLVEIPGLQQLELLEEIYIYSCPSLKELPGISSLQNLTVLYLSCCDSLRSLPVVDKERCRLNVFKCKMLPQDSCLEFERAVERFAFITGFVNNTRIIGSVDESRPYYLVFFFLFSLFCLASLLMPC